MGKLTQVLVKSKECTESGFPKKLSVYHLGEARRVGNSFRVDVLVLREHDLELPSPPAHPRRHQLRTRENSSSSITGGSRKT